MDEENKQYNEVIKNEKEKLSDAAKDKAKKEIMKKVISIIGIKGIAIIILVVLLCTLLGVVFLAGAVYINDLDTKEKATSAKEAAIGNEALNTIIKMEDGKYKISYDKKTGKQAIEAILEDNNMNFTDFNNEEIECLYKCLKAEWATTYPNLGEKVDNKDIDSEYVQGVITVKRGQAGDSQENIIKLEYKPYEEFCDIKDESALKFFSMKDGNIIVANWSSNETIYTPSDSMPEDIKSQYTNTGEQISITETAINYRSMIGIHTIPFELLLSLLVNTEKVDFVNELADLAFESTIEITVYDNMTEITTIETEHIKETTTYKKWVDYYTTTISQEITAGGTLGHTSQYNNYENNKEINSTEKKEIDYTLTTTRITKDNSYVVGLSNVSSWLADIKNEYTYVPKYGQEENLGLGSPNTYTQEQEKETISTNDSEVVAFKNSKQSTRTTVDSYNNSTHTTTVTCTITGARKMGTLSGLRELTKNTSTTNEYKYESGAKQTSNVGKKFKEVYDKHPGAQAQLDNVSSWLFELLEQTESTVDYVSVMKYLLYICTGENYGVTDISELLEIKEILGLQTNQSDDYIVNTSMSQSDIVLSKEQLEEAIKINYSGKCRENLLNCLDDFIYIQETYKVNAAFAVAVAVEESSGGTNWSAIDSSTYNWMSVTGKYNGKSYRNPNSENPRTWKVYPSFNVAVQDFGDLIENGAYYFKVGKNTVKTIATSYCNEQWGVDVVKQMNKIFNSIGITTGQEDYSVGGTGNASGFWWPIDKNYKNTRISSKFGYRTHPISGKRNSFHSGIDITGGGINGKNVIASYSGTVTCAGRQSGYGNVIYIKHDNGIETRYAHLLDGSICVKAGQTVQTGQIIGKVGSTGNSTGPHLHFEVRVNGTRKNPLSYVKQNFYPTKTDEGNS